MDHATTDTETGPLPDANGVGVGTVLNVWTLDDTRTQRVHVLTLGYVGQGTRKRWVESGPARRPLPSRIAPDGSTLDGEQVEGWSRL